MYRNQGNQCPLPLCECSFTHQVLDPWHIHPSPLDHWKPIKVQRKFLQMFAEKQGLQFPHEWFTFISFTIFISRYKITQHQLENAGGSPLLKLHSRSPSRAISEAFPEVKWLPWKFAHPKVNSIFLLSLISRNFGKAKELGTPSSNGRRKNWNWKTQRTGIEFNIGMIADISSLYSMF